MLTTTLRSALPILAAAAILAGCAVSSSFPSSTAPAGLNARHLPPPGTLYSWLQPGINSTHVADNTAETKLTVGNVHKLIQGWSFGTGAQIGNPIVTDGSTAYADSGDGYLYAIDVLTGAQRWRFRTYYGNAWATSPAISGNLIYVPCLVGGSSQQNGLCAVNRVSGALRWSYYDNCNCLPPSAIGEGPVVSGSTVVIGYYNKHVYRNYTITALDSTTGAVLWVILAGNNTVGYGLENSTPAIDNGNIFAADAAGVCSYQLATGNVNWCNGPSDGGTAPAVSNGVVYVNTFSHGFYALNETTGSQIWQYAPCSGCGNGYDDPPAIAGSTVYFSGINQGYLYALNASTGSLIFNTSGDGSSAYTDSSPSVANGVVYVACNMGLCAYNASNGTLLGAFGAGGSTLGSPAVASGRVYTVCGYNNACMYHL